MEPNLTSDQVQAALQDRQHGANLGIGGPLQPAPQPHFNQNFIQQRAKRMQENRQDISYNFLGKSTLKEGYEKARLVFPSAENVNEDFLCAICQKIVNTPIECDNGECGQLYCTYCLNMKMYDKNLQQDQKECLVCKRVNGGYRVPSALVLKMLNVYKVTCSTCDKPFDLKNLTQHEIMCQQSVCSNELCGLSLIDDQLVLDDLDDDVEQVLARNLEGSANRVKFTIMGEEFVSCSKKCKKVTKFAYMLRQQNEQEILRAFESMLRKKLKKQSQAGGIAAAGGTYVKDNNHGMSGNRISTDNASALIQFDKLSNRQNYGMMGDFASLRGFSTNHYEDGDEEQKQADKLQQSARFSLKMLNFCPDIHEFSWDPDNSSKEIAFSSDYRHAFLFETNYFFRTMISNRPFMDGQHYWEIIADARTEHELKIGVTTQQKFSVSNAFCDYDFGFGFYGFGQLRHGSNAEGRKYGKPFKKKGILGVYLDMELGTMSFALDGEFFGQAFQDDALRRGPIWAAISLLHTGGCTLISGLQKPSYFTH